MKNYGKYSCYFGEDNIYISKSVLNAVHIIVPNLAELNEIDFYLFMKGEVYLLRLRNSRLNKLTFYNGETIYIIIEKIFSLGIREELREIVIILEKLDISKILEKKTFAIMNYR